MLDRYTTLSQTVHALADRCVSSTALVDAALERIVSDNAAINAIACPNFQSARKAAKDADRKLARGERQPLLGVPITVKESLRVKGLPTTWGIASHRDWTPDEESEAVVRLRSAGAVIIGKTNVASGLSDWQTSNPIYGTTRNPYDHERTAGGSSGGAAAALSAGLTCLDIGSDLLGSIRIPAHFCGVYGLRPSAGLVSKRGHALPGTLSPNEFSELGPMARSAGDLGIALDVLAGPGRSSPTLGDLRGLRVLLLDTHPLTRTSQAVRHAVRSCGYALVAAGADVSMEDGDPVHLGDDTRLFLQLIAPINASSVNDAEFANWKERMAGCHPDDSLATYAWRACFASARDWVMAREATQRRRLSWQKLFTQVDIVLCPVSTTVAFPHDSRPFYLRHLIIDGEPSPYFDQVCWSTSASLCGLPAATFPWTQDRGMPLGLQIIGPHGEDRKLLQVLSFLEEMTKGFLPLPPPPTQTPT